MKKVKIYISLKSGVVDREGEAIKNGLKNLGYACQDIRVGKVIELNVQKKNRDELDKWVREICDQYLVNGVLETYEYHIEE